MMKTIVLFALCGAFVLFLGIRTKGSMTREMSKKTRLTVRILGYCTAMLIICGPWYGHFSAIPFVLMATVGIAAGFIFHIWAEHMREKHKDEPLTEKEKQKFLKFLSMGKRKFVLIYGVFWGCLFTVMIGVSMFLEGSLPSRNQLLPLGTAILTGLIMFSILGVTLGLMIWNGIQNIAQKYSLLENPSDDKK